jgi:hypothetical protein
LWYGACFCLLHGKEVELTDEAVFHDTSEIIAIEKAHGINSSKTNISATARNSIETISITFLKHI